MTEEDVDQLRRLGRYDLLEILDSPKRGACGKASVKQVGGNHYKENSIQPWDVIDAYNLGFYEGNVLKYLLRDKVNKREDLLKAIHYLEKIIEGFDK